MAMVVKNNMSAVNTLNILNKNSDALAKSLAKVSSGMKINGAADDASGYAISERMRVQIRGLEQDIANAQNASSMLKVAEGAVSSTVEILKTLKEKAINAANDTNTDADRATIQKEFEQRIDQINDNAMITYNGKYMLDGMSTVGGVGSAQESVKGFLSSLSDTSKVGMAAIDEAVVAASGGVFANTQELVDSFLSDLESNSGSSESQKKAFLKEYCGIDLDNEDTGSITGTDAGGNTVKTAESIVPENSSGPISSWPMPALGGSATFNGLTITWPSTLADIPDQTSGGTGATATVAAQQQVIKALNSEWMASCLNLIADSFDMSFEDSGATVRTINLVFENKSDSNNLAYVTSSLSGTSRDNMTTNGLTLTFNMHYYSSLNDADVNGKDTAVSGGGYLDRTLAHELTHAVMSANIKNFGDLPKYIKEGMAELVHGVDDTRRSGILELADPANSSEFRKMLEGEVDDIDGVTASSAYGGGFMLLRYMAKQSAGGNGAFTTSSDGDYYSFSYKLTDKAFTFQVGTQANQSIRMGFADMRAKSLGLENAKQERVSVTTRENAVNALGTLDYALAKALDQQTTIGAMQSRMEHTINTLTIAMENVQKSESTIRDADMAKEMTEFTKHNLLTQMAQSMLAQANQSSSSVLSLLQ